MSDQKVVQGETPDNSIPASQKETQPSVYEQRSGIERRVNLVEAARRDWEESSLRERARRVTEGTIADRADDDEENCTCPTECDCENYDAGLVSEECPVHNWHAKPSQTCPQHGETPVTPEMDAKIEGDVKEPDIPYVFDPYPPKGRA